ncbi:MAG: hypothetical protein WEC39_00965 [Patescibacteria group bacterium]
MMDNLKVSLVDKFELELAGPQRRERLKIRSLDYSHYYLSEFLFSQLGLMHLLAPYFPKVVETDFLVQPLFRNLIGEMYKSCNHPAPEFITPLGGFGFGIFPDTSAKKVVIAYSGGKDSMWNLWWAQEKYGRDNVLAVHIRGLNQGQQREEANYVLKQALAFRFPLNVLDLLNSSRNWGPAVMRSRDIFLTGLLVPLALDFGAGKIITEERLAGDPKSHFTSGSESFAFFNYILKYMRVPVKVTWRYLKKYHPVRDLYLNRPDWMPLVCNCFSVSYRKVALRKHWNGENGQGGLAPTLKLYDSQCGSCFKCRPVNLGRILYDPNTKVSRDDARAFLLSTARWIEASKGKWADIIDSSFKQDFKLACRRYGLDYNRLLK